MHPQQEMDRLAMTHPNSTPCLDVESMCIEISAYSMSNIAHPSVPRYFRWSWLIHRSIALLLLVPATPLIVLLVLIVRLTSRGPGIYRQARVGRHGRVFWMYKIRSMSHNAEKHTGAVWCKDMDPRVTRVGTVLREFHLDELPQLVNVLKGDMSLIGPRPERPEFVSFLARQIPNYLQRLSVAPGISGLAQINLPPDTDVASVRKKTAVDRIYIEQASFLFDLRIGLCTLLKLFGLKRIATARRLLRLDVSSAAVEPLNASKIDSPSGGNGSATGGNGSATGGNGSATGGNGSANGTRLTVEGHRDHGLSPSKRQQDSASEIAPSEN